jgi:hypothetical protein
LHRNCLLKHVIEKNVEGRVEMTGRWGRRHKQLLDDLKEKRRYWKLKEEALDHTLWRTHFGKGYKPVVRQTTEWNEYTRDLSPFLIVSVSTNKSAHFGQNIACMYCKDAVNTSAVSIYSLILLWLQQCLLYLMSEVAKNMRSTR